MKLSYADVLYCLFVFLMCAMVSYQRGIIYQLESMLALDESLYCFKVPPQRDADDNSI
jgi:hypothetical protein